MSGIAGVCVLDDGASLQWLAGPGELPITGPSSTVAPPRLLRRAKLAFIITTSLPSPHDNHDNSFWSSTFGQLYSLPDIYTTRHTQFLKNGRRRYAPIAGGHRGRSKSSLEYRSHRLIGAGTHESRQHCSRTEEENQENHGQEEEKTC